MLLNKFPIYQAYLHDAIVSGVKIYWKNFTINQLLRLLEEIDRARYEALKIGDLKAASRFAGIEVSILLDLLNQSEFNVNEICTYVDPNVKPINDPFKYLEQVIGKEFSSPQELTHVYSIIAISMLSRTPSAWEVLTSKIEWNIALTICLILMIIPLVYITILKEKIEEVKVPEEEVQE